MTLGWSLVSGMSFSEREHDGVQNQIACMWALSNGTILSPQQLLAVYAGEQCFALKEVAACLANSVACMFSAEYGGNVHRSRGAACVSIAFVPESASDQSA